MNSYTIESLQARLASPMADLTAFLNGQVEDFEPQIRFLVDYCLKNSGKRIRPSLVFLSGNGEDPKVLEKLVQVSAVVEMVHIATLVHDDILDGADKRRGQPTISSKYGQHTAVLLGDALFSHALHMASQFDTVEVCRFVSRSTRRVCSGEILQTFRRGDWKLELDDYLEMLDMKTGELFSISTYLGGLLSGYSKQYCDTLRKFGSELGIAYQAYDDLTDFIGDESKIGKTLGTDLVTGKATLPLIQLFQMKNQSLTDQLSEALSTGNGTEVRRILESNGIYEAGINFVSDLWNKAVSTLDELPDTLSAKQNLTAISQLLREKLDELEQSHLPA
ncbi:polyprenyl synthetase family protein [bacterium]|nr:polyprenyl synthetase family protein [Opitutales bacterium]MDB2499348.1 polyprenyl synthetase family protein [bacterium]